MSELQLTEDQKSADVAFTDFLLDKNEKYMVIDGSPGTGKSFLTKHLLDGVNAKWKLLSLLLGDKNDHTKFSTCLTATTNQAAEVLAAFTGEVATTVHSKLGLVPKRNFKTGETNFIKGRNYEIVYNTLFVIDEGSALSDDLLETIDESTVNCKVLIIGDEYQTAPVKGKWPAMAKMKCPRVTLNQVMRHNKAIADAGAKFKETVRTGAFTDIVPNDAEIVKVDGPTFQKMVNDEFTASSYTSSKAKLLAWQNKVVNKYNQHIRLNMGLPYQLGEKEVLITNKPIISGKGLVIASVGKQVTITDTDCDSIRKGIAGRVVEVNNMHDAFLPDNYDEVDILIKHLSKIKDWPTFFEIQDTWLDLRPMFSSTTHKSQGSSYDRTYINLTDIGKCNIASDVARMCYVALTRAREQVILYGELPPKYCGGT